MNGWSELDRFLRADLRDVGCAQAMAMLHGYVELAPARGTRRKSGSRVSRRTCTHAARAVRTLSGCRPQYAAKSTDRRSPPAASLTARHPLLVLAARLCIGTRGKTPGPRRHQPHVSGTPQPSGSIRLPSPSAGAAQQLPGPGFVRGQGRGRRRQRQGTPRR